MNHQITTHPQANYGNWIPKRLLLRGWGAAVLLFAAFILSRLFASPVILTAALLILCASATLMCAYMQFCHHSFSFRGGNVMGQIHQFLIKYLPWDGNGTLLDIGCGSAALTIRCAKTFPRARITGIDYWGKEWDYAKRQCEENAALEQVSSVTFLQGDAARLPFEDESFDAAISNFVFHEVRTQSDKCLVVKEALRIVKKGGVFAFHDLFEQKALYGNMEDFVAALKAAGITELYYEPHTERIASIPWYVRAPLFLSGLGILYGVK